MTTASLAACSARIGDLERPAGGERRGLLRLTADTMVLAMRWLLAGDPDPAQLDHFGRPTFVRPCLSGADRPKCGTAQWVGHSCYGCIGQKFPLSRELLKWTEARKCASESLLT